MKLIAGGDSMIWGIELKDCLNGSRNGYSQNTLTALLAKQAGLDYTCCAYPGNANNAISRSIITYCEKNTGIKSVVVMWTFVQRVEFRFNFVPNSPRPSGWYSINSWHCQDDFQFQSQYLDAKNLREYAKVYYKHVGSIEYYEQYNFLKEVLFLQLYLERKNIPYLFLTTNNESFEHENYKRHQVDDDLSSLYQQIDWNQWFFFPKGQGENQTNAPRGFYQWAMESNYIIGPTGHPLEQAHIDAAELIKERFNELV
jgi:hypothetical protein